MKLLIDYPAAGAEAVDLCLFVVKFVFFELCLVKFFLVVEVIENISFALCVIVL